MSLIVGNIDYSRALRNIRELVLDTSPVQCFRVSSQDFSFIKDSTGFVLDTTVQSFSDIEKVYDLMRFLRHKEIAVEILPDYIPNVYCTELEDFNFDSILEPKTIYRNNYFSTYTIERIMEGYFAYYCPYDGVPKSISSMYDRTDYLNKRKLIFWVAYYLIDEKRMNYASSVEMINRHNSNAEGGGGSSCGSDGELKNIDVSITTKVGDVFSITEKTSDDGKGMEGFTSFWGDKYSYLTKLQLWIRDRFEKQFKDFSLRDNAMISQTFTLEKGWEPFAWKNTLGFNNSSDDDFIVPDNRLPK